MFIHSPLQFQLLAGRPRSRRATVEDFYDEVPSVARLDGVVEVLSSDRTSEDASYSNRNYSDHRPSNREYSMHDSRLRERFSDSEISSQDDHEPRDYHDDSTTTTSTSEVVTPPPPVLNSHTEQDSQEHIDRVIEIPRSSEDMSVTSETASDATPIPSVYLILTATQRCF